MKSYFSGIAVVFAISLVAFALANLLAFSHFSPSSFGIILGLIFSPLFFKHKEKLANGVNFMAKKILRLGIILYGFYISIDELASVGISGIFAASCVICSIIFLALLIGRFLKLDWHSSLLVGSGSAICGAAALLATESILKANPLKSVIALSFVVIFGLIFMFGFPFIYHYGLLANFSDLQVGIYMGLSLHEVANVAGAAEMAKSFGLSQEAANVAIILKMTRVILLVPFLLILSFVLASKNEKSSAKKIQIPYFALAFLGVIILNSFIAESSLDSTLDSTIEAAKMLAGICIVQAMVALGLQVNIRQFFTLGGKAFILSFMLAICLLICGYVLSLVLF